MISYAPFWKTLEESKETTYSLINKYCINPTTLQRMRHNQSITTSSIDELCQILRCGVEDIMKIFITDQHGNAGEKEK